MATRRFEIVAGPSKWDLIIRSLAEGQEVEITLKDWNKFWARILSVRPEDGSRESWNITGHLTHEDAIPGYWAFKGHYSTKTRTGFVYVREFVNLSVLSSTP